MKYKNILLLVLPFIVFVSINVIYFIYFERAMINHFDCGCFTHGINYRIAGTFILLVVTIIYVVLFLLLTLKINNKKISLASYITNSSLAIFWIIYLIIY